MPWAFFADPERTHGTYTVPWLPGNGEPTVDEAVKIEQALYELAAEEMAVCLRVKGVGGRYELSHRLRPPTLEDWRGYERDLRSTVEVAEHEADALQFHSATLEAAGALYDRLFRGAAGYRLAEAMGTIQAEQIPLHHKEMVVRALSDVGPASHGGCAEAATEPALFSLDDAGIEVALEASRNGVPFASLIHIFRAPSAGDRVEYSRVTSQAMYVRNSHSLKTILPSRLPGLVALYDRLIEQVRGYAAGGAPLADRAAIVRQMDPLHKKVAVQLLFGD